MDSYGSVTERSSDGHQSRRPVVLFTLVMVVIVGVFGASVSAAQTQTNLISADTLSMAQQVPVEGEEDTPVAPVDEPAEVAELDEPVSELDALEAELDARDEQIATLQEQLVFMQQVLIEVQAHNDQEKAVSYTHLTLPTTSRV